jgi:hypothetical protein
MMWDELDLTPEENREDQFLIAQLKRISKPGPRTPSQAQPAARGLVALDTHFRICLVEQPCGARKKICHKHKMTSQVIIGAHEYWRPLYAVFAVLDQTNLL